jgi:hypothetical protein
MKKACVKQKRHVPADGLESMVVTLVDNAVNSISDVSRRKAQKTLEKQIFTLLQDKLRAEKRVHSYGLEMNRALERCQQLEVVVSPLKAQLSQVTVELEKETQLRESTEKDLSLTRAMCERVCHLHPPLLRAVTTARSGCPRLAGAPFRRGQAAGHLAAGRTERVQNGARRPPPAR